MILSHIMSQLNILFPNRSIRWLIVLIQRVPLVPLVPTNGENKGKHGAPASRSVRSTLCKLCKMHRSPATGDRIEVRSEENGSGRFLISDFQIFPKVIVALCCFMLL